jgi:S-adenosylmethionine:tRNA ribosyltransferase-isomerase
LKNKDISINREFAVESYNYSFDETLIASHPIYPKESARLLIYFRDSGKIVHSNFGELKNYIPEETAILFNDTKVIKARMFGVKKSGGKVEVLLNRPLNGGKFSIFIRGKVKIGTEIELKMGLSLRVEELIADGSRVGTFWREEKQLDFFELLKIVEEIGELPLPPYIDRRAEEVDERDYQPIFAKNSGAVASPTASLHFSEEMLKDLKERHQIEYLTLHVGAGTFKPVEVDDIRGHSLHKELFEIPVMAKRVIESDTKILSVGTTVTRTVEYYWRSGEISGEADLFLHPNNRPQRVDYLLTNFHLPKSTLLMLVASFIGVDKVHEIYREAVKERYRFYSYGDGMLII